MRVCASVAQRRRPRYPPRDRFADGTGGLPVTPQQMAITPFLPNHGAWPAASAAFGRAGRDAGKRTRFLGAQHALATGRAPRAGHLNRCAVTARYEAAYRGRCFFQPADDRSLPDTAVGSSHAECPVLRGSVAWSPHASGSAPPSSDPADTPVTHFPGLSVSRSTNAAVSSVPK